MSGIESRLTPQVIVRELDEYIIGQKEAKRAMAIALRNRWRRMNADPAMREEIVPANILMIGPTGVGKTEIARRLARMVKAPFLKVEASKYTEVGYVGRDVESMIRDLTDSAVAMVRQELQETVREQARDAAERIILDILIPPSSTDSELNERTREKFREKLIKGELDERQIEVEIQERRAPSMQIFGPQGMDDMGMNMQELLGSLTGKKKTKRTLPIREARKALEEQEAQKLVNQDQVVDIALERVQSQGIVFIDEIDKIASSGSDAGGRSADVSRQGVQRDLLPIVEGSAVNTKHGVVKTDHILFIGSGAFHVAKPSDLIPELQGRFPIRVELESLTEEDFFHILTIPRNALTRQYQALVATENVQIDFSEDALREIARIAALVNRQVENIGARRLQTILSTLLEELLFSIPEDLSEGEIVIDKTYVEKRLARLATDKDLSHYIL
jgi:ATP-dependent HslUV protease ATP-binding subunit HslU